MRLHCHSPRYAKYVSAVALCSLRPELTGFDKDYAINNKLTPFISMQNHYSLVYREEEREMFPTLKVRISFLWHNVGSMKHIWIQHFGVGSIPWSPLARGVLTRPNNEHTKRSETDPCVFAVAFFVMSPNVT